ncbi:MAG: hypothetical protein JWM85_2669 [Acidimicrobiaceae bacterium]|nr:hypothetical protein [Acidimicrobiaceae bacterium]
MALDVSAIPAEPAGAGRYVEELAGALDSSTGASLTLYARRGDGARWAARAPRAEVLAVAPAGRPARLLWGELGLGPALRRAGGTDGVLHAPHYTMPAAFRSVRSPLPVVVTVHDLTFCDHPEWHERSKVVLFRRAIAHAARFADLVVCVSSATARRFEELFSPHAPVAVIPHGVDHARFAPEEPEPGADAVALARLGVHRPYLLHLGTVEPRKDLVSLLSAFERIAHAEPELRLVLAGQEGWGSEPFERALALSPVASRVARLGYVADADVPALLRRSAAVVYPALEEGFGLPALEALACGAPLVTTAGSVMAETAAGAALVAPPAAPRALAEVIEAALSAGGRTERRQRGLEVAAGYTWQACAAAHLAAYRRVAG